MKKSTLFFAASAFLGAGNISFAQNCFVSVIPSSVNICAGGCVSLNALYQSFALCNTVGYSWTPATGLSNPNISNPVACPSATTTYIVTGCCVNTGCCDTASVIVNVAPPPPPPIISGLDTICLGTTDTLCGAGAAGGCLGYTWMPGGQTSQCIVVAPTVSTTYTVICTDVNGCNSSATHLLTVVNCPTDISENHLISEIKIYPNPFSKYFLVEIKNAALLPFEIRIYDLLGKEIKTIALRNSETKIYREGLLPGMYLYEISRNGNSIGNGKLLVE